MVGVVFDLRDCAVVTLDPNAPGVTDATDETWPGIGLPLERVMDGMQ